MSNAAKQHLTLFGFLVLAPFQPLNAQDGESFADIAPLFEERCVICHSGEGAPLGLRLDSYEGVVAGSVNGPVVKENDPPASELVRRIKGTSEPRMPMTGPPYLSDSEIAMIEGWVAAGLPEGGDVSTGPDDTQVDAGPAPGEPVTYSDVAPILAARCVKCHADEGLMGGPPEGFRMTSYAATLAVEDRARVVPGNPNASELVRRIRGQARPRMPFDGAPFLSEDEIRLIEQWIADGARNTDGESAAVPAGAKVRLHGTLQSRWRLDELDLKVGANTRIDKSPAAGSYVEVRGRLDASGNVDVERIRTR